MNPPQDAPPNVPPNVPQNASQNASGGEPKPRPELRAVASVPAPDPAPHPDPAPDPAGARAPEPAAGSPARRARAQARVEARVQARAAAAKAPAKAPAKIRPKPRAKPAAPRRRTAKAGTVAAPAAAGALVTGPEVGPARLKARHWLALLAFVAMVVLPLGATVGYLWTRAADQYHSEVAFSIRSEDASSAAAGLIGAITNIGAGSASDADILFEYIRSQRIVEAIDRDLDLRAIYNRAGETDPVFTLGEDATIEDLVAHWGRMVDVAFESGAGILHIRANAFDPGDAQAIAEAILAQSSALVNRLSDQAREDAVRFARDELAEAEGNLRAMRARLADFRRENRIVDPSGDVAGQMGLLNALQTELAQALVERDMLLSFVGEEDQRVLQANRRITAVTARIEEERASLGVPGSVGALPDVVGRYEELLVDLEFANTAYTQTLAAVAAARAEARRQSRYLAPHIEPTYAERALYPRRLLITGLTALFLMLGWGVVMLVYYNIRDNR